MVQDCRAGRPFERGKALVLDETRDRHELVAARAIEVIVMHRVRPSSSTILRVMPSAASFSAARNTDEKSVA